MGWCNLLVCAAVSFLKVAARFYKMLLADPVPGSTSALGLDATTTLLWHGVGGVPLLMAIVAMAVWRGFQRFVWRRDYGRPVQWAFLLAGMVPFAVLALHGVRLV